MRVTADTNTIVSGLLWHGPPRQVLDKARQGEVELYTSPHQKIPVLTPSELLARLAIGEQS